MANLHVLTRSGDDFQVAAHVAIPATNNPAGFAWRTVLLRSGIGGTTILPVGDGTGGTILQTEKDTIATGALYEQVTVIRVASAGAVLADVNAFLDAEFTRISNETLARLQIVLGQYGRTR